MLASFVKHDSIFVQILGLSDNRVGSLIASRCTSSVTQTLARTARVHCVKVLLRQRHSHAWLTRANVRQRSVALSFSLSRCQRKSRLAVAVLELVRVLAHVVSDFLDLLKVSRPLGHAIGRLLLLQTLQDSLVLDRNLHQLILSLHSVQTCLFNSIRVVKARIVFLHNVGHFLEQNPVFSLDLSITPYFKNRSIG